jgi:inorganic pyrophosphatase
VDAGFWATLDQFVADSEIVIDRPKDRPHPRIPAAIYPVDYGYLTGAKGGDGEGLDVWLGSLRPARLQAVLCTADRGNRDAEVKLVLGCTAEETAAIVRFLNTGTMSAVLVERPT